MHSGGHADEMQQLRGAFSAPLLIDLESRAMRNVLPGRNVVVNVKSSNHVVQHAELFEQADLLKGPSDSKPHAPVRRQGGKGGARERQRTGIGSVNTADEIEQRRFPRPVRTDDGEYRSSGDL